MDLDGRIRETGQRRIVALGDLMRPGGKCNQCIDSTI